MDQREVGTALIPAPRDGADNSGGAAPGPQCRETGYAARSEALEAVSVGGGVRWYCDVHRTRRNGEGFRIIFTADGSVFGEADGFEEVPARAGDRVFVDTLPLQHTEGVIVLLRRGVEVYYLRRPTLISRKREELGLSKTTKNDVRALMSIEEKWFRRVSEDFLVMRRMIAAYRSLLKTRQQLLNKSKALSEQERDVLKPVIKSIEEQMVEMARRIAEEASKRYPVYNRVVDGLGVGGNVGVMEALAELITYLDPSKGFRKTANLLGLFRPIRGRRKNYSGHLRRALQRLTASANNIRTRHLTAKKEKEILSRIWRIYRQEALGRLAIPAKQQG